jgi:hypothetical protein
MAGSFHMRTTGSALKNCRALFKSGTVVTAKVLTGRIVSGDTAAHTGAFNKAERIVRRIKFFM